MKNGWGKRLFFFAFLALAADEDVLYNEAVEQGPPLSAVGGPFSNYRSSRRRTMVINAAMTARKNASSLLCFVGITPFLGGAMHDWGSPSIYH